MSEQTKVRLPETEFFYEIAMERSAEIKGIQMPDATTNEKITDEWLLSIGFEDDDEAEMIYVFGPKHIPFYLNKLDGAWYFGALEIVPPETRADVQEMLVKLGVKTDSTEARHAE